MQSTNYCEVIFMKRSFFQFENKERVSEMEMVIKVEGMSCNHCKMAVEGALKKLSGVIDAVVSLENKHVTVSYEENKVTFEQMKEAIEDQGYDVIA